MESLDSVVKPEVESDVAEELASTPNEDRLRRLLKIFFEEKNVDDPAFTSGYYACMYDLLNWYVGSAPFREELCLLFEDMIISSEEDRAHPKEKKNVNTTMDATEMYYDRSMDGAHGVVGTYRQHR